MAAASAAALDPGCGRCVPDLPQREQPGDRREGRQGEHGAQTGFPMAEHKQQQPGDGRSGDRAGGVQGPQHPERPAGAAGTGVERHQRVLRGIFPALAQPVDHAQAADNGDVRGQRQQRLEISEAT